MPDAVVIGAGPNGLVAGIVLADHGWDVLVLEAEKEPGGAVRSAELMEAGFVNDLCSGFYPLAVASPVMAALGLEAVGLRWRFAPIAFAHPSSDGTCPAVALELEETVRLLETAGQGDGDGWRELYSMWRTVRDPLLDAMFRPFPPVRPLARLAGRLRPSELAPFARFAMLPARRLGTESFATDAGRRLVAGCAMHTDLPPEVPISGLLGWMLACLAQDRGWPVPEGGAGQLSAALARRLERGGGRLRTGALVSEVIVRSGRAVAVRTADGEEIDADRAVLADVPAPTLLLDLVGADHLPAGVEKELERRFEWDHATVKVDWNLDGPIPWEAEPARRAGTVHVAEGVDALTVVATQLSLGLVPDPLFVVVGQPGLADPTRQPDGTQTAWAYTHVPQQVRGDAGEDGVTGSWDAGETDAMADRIEAEIETLAPGFRHLIRGRHVLTPKSFEQTNRALIGGAVNGGTAQLHQLLFSRPLPGWGRPATPVSSLFLASASAHPGGGVHGACGANAAHAALRADWLRRARNRFLSSR